MAIYSDGKHNDPAVWGEGKIPVCSECGDGAIEQSIKKIWNESMQRWEENDGEPIYDCADCGEVDIEWVTE